MGLLADFPDPTSCSLESVLAGVSDLELFEKCKDQEEGEEFSSLLAPLTFECGTDLEEDPDCFADLLGVVLVLFEVLVLDFPDLIYKSLSL